MSRASLPSLNTTPSTPSKPSLPRSNSTGTDLLTSPTSARKDRSNDHPYGIISTSSALLSRSNSSSGVHSPSAGKSWSKGHTSSRSLSSLSTQATDPQPFPPSPSMSSRALPSPDRPTSTLKRSGTLPSFPTSRPLPDQPTSGPTPQGDVRTWSHPELVGWMRFKLKEEGIAEVVVADIIKWLERAGGAGGVRGRGMDGREFLSGEGTGGWSTSLSPPPFLPVVLSLSKRLRRANLKSRILANNNRELSNPSLSHDREASTVFEEEEGDGGLSSDNDGRVRGLVRGWEERSSASEAGSDDEGSISGQFSPRPSRRDRRTTMEGSSGSNKPGAGFGIVGGGGLGAVRRRAESMNDLGAVMAGPPLLPEPLLHRAGSIDKRDKTKMRTSLSSEGVAEVATPPPPYGFPPVEAALMPEGGTEGAIASDQSSPAQDRKDLPSTPTARPLPAVPAPEADTPLGPTDASRATEWKFPATIVPPLSSSPSILVPRSSFDLLVAGPEAVAAEDKTRAHAVDQAPLIQIVDDTWDEPPSPDPFTEDPPHLANMSNLVRSGSNPYGALRRSNSGNVGPSKPFKFPAPAAPAAPVTVSGDEDEGDDEREEWSWNSTGRGERKRVVTARPRPPSTPPAKDAAADEESGRMRTLVATMSARLATLESKLELYEDELVGLRSTSRVNASTSTPASPTSSSVAPPISATPISASDECTTCGRGPIPSAISSHERRVSDSSRSGSDKRSRDRSVSPAARDMSYVLLASMGVGIIFLEVVWRRLSKAKA